MCTHWVLSEAFNEYINFIQAVSTVWLLLPWRGNNAKVQQPLMLQRHSRKNKKMWSTVSQVLQYLSTLQQQLGKKFYIFVFITLWSIEWRTTFKRWMWRNLQWANIIFDLSQSRLYLNRVFTDRRSLLQQFLILFTIR